MLKRILIGAVAGVSLLIGGAHAPAAQAAPAANTKPVGVHALKGMPPVPGSVHTLTTCGVTNGCFHYVYGQQGGITSDGIYGNSYMASPFLKTTTPGDAHSLQEMALSSADTQQTIEVGWTRDLSVCGASSTGPCLFTYAWKNGTGLCYNGCGYVDYAPNTLNVGAQVPSADLSTVKAFAIQHGGTPSGWYVSYAGTTLGYWPDTIWTASPAVTFTTAGFFQVFGEVAGKSTSNWPPCTDMGTGIQGSLGQSNVPKPSSWSSIQYNGLATTAVNLTMGQSYPTGYTYSLSATSPPGNTRSFSLGGPGANAAGTGVGTTGSC